MTARRTIAVGIAAMALAAAALVPAVALGGGARASSSHTVVLKSLRFHPSALTINKGDTVTFVWRDNGERHNVTFHGFHSHTMGHGAYTIRFLGKGTFAYRCTIHEAEGMRGKIVVH